MTYSHWDLLSGTVTGYTNYTSGMLWGLPLKQIWIQIPKLLPVKKSLTMYCCLFVFLELWWCWWLAIKEQYWVYKGHFFIPPSFINIWFYWQIKVAYIESVQCGSQWCKSWSWKVQEPGTIRAGDDGCLSLKRERVCTSFIFLFQRTGWCPSG